MSESLLDPRLVWGLIPRFVGLLYVFAFASLIPQLESLLGSRGLVHAQRRLDHIRRDFPGVRRFFEYPSVLWLNSSDTFVRLIPWLGTLCGLIAVYGGPLGPWASALAFVLWLSIEPAALLFPWDTMLQEVGFLVLFLPTPETLPSLEASALPLPAVAFMFRWLVLRLMLGFGKVKFLLAKKDDNLYLRGFFVWMPLPSPLAWFGHHAPQWLLKQMIYFMFAAEVIAPLLGFFTGIPRLISCALLVGLMVGIQVTGNWGYFNIGYIMLCVCLLDTQSSLFEAWHEPWASSAGHWPDVGINALLGLMFLTGLIQLIIADSWVGRSWMHWPLDNLIWNRRWARVLIRYFRAISPFRVVNGYGVFPPNAGPPIRIVSMFEGSDDGQSWKAYPYKFTPSRPHQRAPFVAPHHPRMDMAQYYAGLCAHDASYYAIGVGDGTPYAAGTSVSWLERAAQRLLEGEPLFLRQFAHNPFPDAPPKFVRVSGVLMTPTRIPELRKSGVWWHMRRLGSLVPARTKESWVDEFHYPEPELFHPDWVDYKRRSAALRALKAAFVGGAEPDQAVLAGSDLSAEDVRRFWHELVPLLRRDRGQIALVHGKAGELRGRFGMHQLHRFERLLERYAWLLRLRSERHQYADAQPKIPIESNFRYHLFLHDVVCDGREAYLDALAHPEQLAARVDRSSDPAQIWALFMLRYDVMMAHVCCCRWSDIGRDSYRLKIPGIFEYYPLLSEIVPPDEEFRPLIEKHPDGEHSIPAFYPPPPLQSVALSDSSS
jgi:lipase maturation factor 1